MSTPEKQTPDTGASPAWEENAAARFQPPYKTVVFTTVQRGESFATFKERVKATLQAQGFLQPAQKNETANGEETP
jgi:hypothetical protein